VSNILPVASITATPIEEGDVGIILKKNGSYQVFNTHRNFNPEKMTEPQIVQGKLLIALTTALTHPKLMAVLEAASLDPALCVQLESGTIN
jgi:hypothetical protein